MMANLYFVEPSHPILKSHSAQLSMEELKDPNLQRFFDSMFKLARGEQGDQQKAVLVGLAAPQVGRAIRVILVDVKADGKGGVSDLHLYVNPEILEISQEMEEWYEGCYSTGNVRGVVSRPNRVKIKAIDRDGKEFVEVHTGYIARIFQHEIDHLNGICFPERVPENGLLHIVKSEESYAYRNQEGWRNWKATIPQTEWKNYQ